MSIEFKHPYNQIISNGELNINVLNGLANNPYNIVFDAESITVPNNTLGNITNPKTGTLVFDKNDNKMKYYNGTKWISWDASDGTISEIESKINELYKLLDTKIDKVVYSTGSVASASITKTTLNIVFPTLTNNLSDIVEGMYTNNPTGSIMFFALSSGQTIDQVREQLGGKIDSQKGLDGTANKPFQTSTGWCVADGKTWLWRGTNGDIKKITPYLNQDAYLKSIDTNTNININQVIPFSGTVQAVSLNVNQLPSISVSIDGVVKDAGEHTHNLGIVSLNNTGKTSNLLQLNGNNGTVDLNITTSVDGLHTHDFKMTSNTIGKSTSHVHTLLNVDADHMRVAILYYIGEPSTPLTINTAKTRYISRNGDNMTGTLEVANSIKIHASGNIVPFYLKNNSTEKGLIYYDKATNKLILRSNGGTNITINNNNSINTETLKVSSIDAKINNKQIITNINGLDAINGMVNLSAVPVGVPIAYPINKVPDGWLKCNGQVFNTNLYKELAKLFPSGRLPDLRGEFIRGLDDGRGVDPNRGILTKQDCSVGVHKHVLATYHNVTNPIGTELKYRGRYALRDSQQYWWSTNDGTKFLTTVVNPNEAEIFANETRPHNVAFLYIIKAG